MKPIKEYVKFEYKKIGACWRSTKLDKNGAPYYTGILDPGFEAPEGTKLFVFKAKKKQPKSPDLNVVLGIPSTDTTPVKKESLDIMDGLEKQRDVIEEGEEKMKEPVKPDDTESPF
ncbi:MAG: hypothetical protein WC455_17735 [Dehalococcoidia bacterium]|jgi:hypothetical protein